MGKPGKQLIDSMLNKISLPYWVLIGFLIPYLFFFIWPTFMEPQVMEFPRYIPVMDPIGEDLRQILTYSDSWFNRNQTPYIGKNLYPPLATVLFTPLLEREYFSAYRIITIINVLSLIFISLLLPLTLLKNKKATPILMLLFITGIFSYGFQFELERGQFNILAITFSFVAIWIFHNCGKLKLIAYALFIISVQLKVFPFIFILMFVKDWREWKNNIIRFAGLGIANFLSLFLLGPNVFKEFINAIKSQTVKPSVWIGNHSIHSYVSCSISKVGLPNYNCANQDFQLIELVLLAITISCILIIFFKALRTNDTNINPALLLACTLGALIIPSVSHDYTLSFLVAPVAIFFVDIQQYIVDSNNQIRPLKILLILLFSSAYASTLFSYAYKPNSIGLLYQNNFPALFIMLLIITVLYIFARPIVPHPTLQSSEVSTDSE